MSDDMFDQEGKIPTFDREMRNFLNWWRKFMAYATMAKIKDVFKEGRDPNLLEKEVSEMELEDESNKKVRIAVRKNELAMAIFVIAFVTKKSINIIYAACTEIWLDGEAHLVMCELMKRY
jgi:hypothetical protein